MKRYILILFLVIFAIQVFAQSATKAEELFLQKNYSEAAVIYKNLLIQAPKNQLYLYRYARCLQENGKYDLAIDYFEQAGDRYSLRNFYLAEMYAKTYRFEQAIEPYETYLASLEENDERIPYIESQILFCRNAQRYMKRVESVQIVDSIIIALNEINTQIPNIYQERTIRYYSEEGNIFSTQHLLDGWSTPDRLPMPINSNENDINPCVLTDGVTIYFASNREGGLGGYDIYCSRKVDDRYLTPENIGMPFNSTANDYFFIIDENKGLSYLATDRNTKSDSVKIYTMLYNEIKQYIRDTTDEYIRQCAMLKNYERADKSQILISQIIEQNIEENLEDSIFFVINDTLQYTSNDDFKSKDAKEMFNELTELLKAIEEEKSLLDERRKAYISATNDEKKNLASLILVAEKTIRNMDEESSDLTKKIRQTEIKLLNKK